MVPLHNTSYPFRIRRRTVFWRYFSSADISCMQYQLLETIQSRPTIKATVSLKHLATCSTIFYNKSSSYTESSFDTKSSSYIKSSFYIKTSFTAHSVCYTANYLTINDLFRIFHDKPPPSGIREKPTSLSYKSTSFSKAFPDVHGYIKELESALELALQKICFRFAPDRGKSLRYTPNQTCLLYKSSRWDCGHKKTSCKDKNIARKALYPRMPNLRRLRVRKW